MVADPEHGVGPEQTGGGETAVVATSKVSAPAAVPAPATAVCAASPTTSPNANGTPVVNPNPDPDPRPKARQHLVPAVWAKNVRPEVREDFIANIASELQRIRGRESVDGARRCAVRFEGHVLQRSASETEYHRRMEQHLASLRQQGSRSQAQAQPVVPAAPARLHTARPSRTGRRSSRHLSPAELAARDEAYFARLRRMRTAYRDEVAIVYRELCRVNAVIQTSATPHAEASTNLSEFLKNLLKVIHLLEQEPDEMHGIIPQRKRTLAYLDVVETHIQRKVLPMLHRLRHTYSTLLRPIVLNYLKSNARALRRL